MITSATTRTISLVLNGADQLEAQAGASFVAGGSSPSLDTILAVGGMVTNAGRVAEIIAALNDLFEGAPSRAS